MLRLLTFGGLRVLRDDGGTAELSNQRRRLAVLAIAAAAAPHGVPRERALFLLWPDAEADKGRHALNQIVYNLRRELGASPIDATADLRLLTDVMSADLLDFRAAMAAGDHARAAELYTGPFLDGFFVSGAVEFDHWAEEERDRTMRQAVTALEKLAAAAEEGDDRIALITWTRRLVELDPLSARRALAHMRALEHHGEVDAAIAYGRRYDVLARTDGDEVDPAVAAAVERLRAQPTPVPAQAPSRVAADIAAPAPVRAERIADPALPSIVLTPAPTLGSDIAPTVTRAPAISPKQRRRWVLLSVAAALSLAGAVVWSRWQRASLPLGRDDRMLLADVQLPAADSGDARALAIALHSAVQQSARVRLVSPAAISDALQRMGQASPVGALPDSVALELAEREGARYVVSMSVAASGGRDRLVTLRVFDPVSRTVLSSYSATRPSSELVSAIGAVTNQFRRDLGDSARDVDDAMPLPRATTASLEALRLMAGGRAAFNRGLYTDARTLYAAAVALDSGFASAYANLAAVAYVQNNIADGDAQIAKALALSDRLPPRERLLIEAQAARGRGDWLRSATLHRAYLIRYPDDYDVYGMLGYDLMRGRNPGESLTAYDSLLAHRRPSAITLINVAANHSQLNRPAEALAAQAAAIGIDSTILYRPVTNEEFGRTFMELGFADSARALYRRMLARTTADKARGHRSLAYADLYEGRYASALQHLDSAIALGQLTAGSALSVVRDRALLGSTLLALGRADAARAQLREAAQLCLRNGIDPQAVFWTAKPLARLGDVSTVRVLRDSARARTRSTDMGQVSATLALDAELLVAQGRFTEATAAASRAAAGDPSAYIIETLAFALESAGQLDDARRQYEVLATARVGVINKEGQQVARLAPLAIARIDALLGRQRESQRAVGALLERLPKADANLPMFTNALAPSAPRER